MTIKIPKLHRPIFDGLTTDEEKMAAAMAEYEALKDADEEGLDFANKTSMWIAYERNIESQREDRLFNDPLAKYFCQPYGKRLSDSMAFGLALGVFDPPGANIGFGLEGHVLYTAARTKLINDQVDQWVKDTAKADCQVLNLGAGIDTRVYWLESLKKTNSYWEVDTPSVMSHKQKILDDLKECGELPEPFCQRKAISMDFSKESISDLPNFDFSPSTPTFWILEGLIMYLERSDVERLMEQLSKLSTSGSFLSLNFSVSPNGLSIDEIDHRLEGQGWKIDSRKMFGEEGFQYGRYPRDKSANKIVGFATYSKI